VTLPFPLSFSPWDLVLLVVVTAMGTLLAYVPNPRWKAFLVGLPFPFTIANLSLGQRIGPGQALGMAVLFLFMNVVRWLHDKAHLPIVLAIAIGELTYLGIATLLNLLVPNTPIAFWCSLGSVMLLAVLFLILLPRREEQGSRSPLPVAAKAAVIGGVVSVIVILKRLLGGFMAMFPMVGTIAVYEARHSLWTIGRQILVLAVTAGPMMAVMWLTQYLLNASIAASLAAGWVVFLAIMIPITVRQMRPRA
jgi:hypothetical protein